MKLNDDLTTGCSTELASTDPGTENKLLAKLHDDACEYGFQNLSAVTAKPLEWVWYGLIARGKLTLITGEPGVGKSLFALQVAAMVTCGLQIPWNPPTPGEVTPEEPTARGEPGGVLLLAADDGLDDTVRPRLEAAGADIGNVYIQRNSGRSQIDSVTPAGKGRRGSAVYQSALDFERLEADLARLQEGGVEVRLIVIDPIDCYMNSTERNIDLTGVVHRLVELASRSGAAVLVVANSTSSGIGRAGYRNDTIGNVELANAARSVLTIVQDLECEHQRLVLAVKLNLSGNRPGLAFSIRQGVVEWTSLPITLTGEEYFTQAKEKLRNPLVREEVSEITRVTNWLRERLSHGNVSSVAVRHDACENEIAYSTLRRAFRRLGCQALKSGFGSGWIWRLPGKELVSRLVLSPLPVEDVQL